VKRVNRRRPVGTRGSGSLSAILVALVAGTFVLAGCQSDAKSAAPGSNAGSGADAGKDGGTAAKPTVEPALVAFAPANGASKVRLDKKIKIKVSKGTLANVSVTTKKGKAVAGTLSDDQLTWTSDSKLDPNTKYQVSVEAAGSDGTKATSTSSFKTLTPTGTASAYIQPGDGWVVGVGMPVVVNFSRSVSDKNRDEVEEALAVKTTTDVEGSWRWISSQQVQWRPKKYWPANTKVKVTSNLAGVELQPGVWGEAKRTSDFKVGSAVISTVDVAGHKLTFKKDGKVIRTIPVTTGKASMATRNGIKVIMSRETMHRMRSSTIGIKKGDPDYYDIKARYAMRLTYSGEFLHAAPWSMGSQGRANVSHGCTGMSTADAKWVFDNSKVGDVVIYKNSKRKLESDNGYTAWNMTYDSWKNA
jgi:lipoprotein-anchoring transpeptidase ErfK/SrfK